MAGDIQLTNAALLDHNGALRERAYTARSDAQSGFAQSTDAQGLPELRDEALPRATLETFLWEIREQPSWRREADRDADYYDNNQLDADTIKKLQERGQPPLITNLIKPTVDVVLGMEAKSRTDWKVNPEDDNEADPDAALALSVKLKHAEIESRADRACGDSSPGQITAGLGFCDVAVVTD